MSERLEAGALVVGSGAGGALTAALLAEAGRDVLIAEEGAWVAQGEVEPFSLEQIERQYRNAGVTAALGRPSIAYAEGSCAGGGTEVNAGLYHRPPASVLAEWRASHGVRELTEEALAPHCEAIEEALGVGKLPGEAPPASRVLERGAQALGWAVDEVPRWFRYEDGPRRQSMTETFLPRATAAGAQLRCGLRIDRLTTTGGRVTGAAGSLDGRPVEIAAGEVWVCTGAIGTPALLQRSGVRGAGRSLKLHPTAKAVAVFDEEIAAGDVPVHQVKEFGGALSLGGSASRPEHVALALVDDWQAARAAAIDPRHAAVYYAAIRPRGSGAVRVLPGLRDPVVTFRLARADWRLLVSGVARLTQLLLAAGARAVLPSARGAGEIRSTADVPRVHAALRPGGTSLMTVHLMSSVPLGEDPARSPVDSFGSLRAIGGVYVNDASLLPGAPGVNPQGTVMAIARRNVLRRLEEAA